MCSKANVKNSVIYKFNYSDDIAEFNYEFTV